MVKAIELQDVDLSLGRGAARVHILKGVSLTVDRGEAVGLVGREYRGMVQAFVGYALLFQQRAERVRALHQIHHELH